MNSNKPLAYRMRPRNIDEVVGQAHLVGPGGIIRKMAAAHVFYSLILYGPAGTGKTSIASALAGSAGLPFRLFNAATDSKKSLTAAAKAAETGPIVLLLDEIHRLNRINQDFLLPYMESGKIVVIGATTENPYVTIAPAIRSRARIFEVKPLTERDITRALKAALADQKRGLGSLVVTADPAALAACARLSGGDLRAAYTLLELAAKSKTGQNGPIRLTPEDFTSLQPDVSVDADAAGDAHYNTISAFQKSIRGSDVDAALYYLALLIASGDLPVIIRRLTVIAYEDIGLASPEAVDRAITAAHIAESVGLPEARIPLSYAVITLALAPKSNTALLSVEAALAAVKTRREPIPLHLRDAHFKGAEKLGHVGYQYPHDYPNHVTGQQYLPDALTDAAFFKPDAAVPNEARLKKINKQLKQIIKSKKHTKN